MSPMPSRSMFVCAACLLVAVGLHAAAPAAVDFSGIWRLDEAQSDGATVIEQRLRAERAAEQAPQVQPASASSAAASGSGQTPHARGGHGGGHGGMGGGMGGGHGGHGGGGRGNKPAGGDAGTAPNDPPPPLLDRDSLLNVQQDAKSLQVSLDNAGRLDARLDGVARQSLNGDAVVQTRLTAESMQISMQFDGGTRLQQDWAKSADGHHLVVTERWTSPAVQQPIVFRRSYDRLDL